MIRTRQARRQCGQTSWTLVEGYTRSVDDASRATSCSGELALVAEKEQRHAVRWTQARLPVLGDGLERQPAADQLNDFQSKT